MPLSKAGLYRLFSVHVLCLPWSYEQSDFAGPLGICSGCTDVGASQVVTVRRGALSATLVIIIVPGVAAGSPQLA